MGLGCLVLFVFEVVVLVLFFSVFFINIGDDLSFMFILGSCSIIEDYFLCLSVFKEYLRE